jgi:hypothetical protein
MRASEYQSHLFMVRLWADARGHPGEGGDHVGWVGKIQHVTSGEAHAFGDLQTLVTILLSMLPELNDQREQISTEANEACRSQEE